MKIVSSAAAPDSFSECFSALHKKGQYVSGGSYLTQHFGTHLLPTFKSEEQMNDCLTTISKDVCM